MSVTRRFHWLSFGLLLVSFALGSCARSGLNEKTRNFAAYESAVAKLQEKTADLSCTADSDCEVYYDSRPCGLTNITYSEKNIASDEVEALAEEAYGALSPQQKCTLLYEIPFDDNHCVNAVCQFRIKNSPF